MAVRVLLVDDHRIIRDAIKVTLGVRDGIEFIGEASTGADAVVLADELKPDVVVMDIGLTDISGVEATRQITSADPSIKILALTMHAEQEFVTEMLRVGARGYVLKDSPLDELELAIRTVAAGRAYLGKGPADAVLNDYVRQLDVPGRSGPTSRGVTVHLTPRERECLMLLGEGLSTKQIAARLGLSPKTIETHRHQTMRKLGIYSVAGLVKYAIREGLTSLDD